MHTQNPGRSQFEHATIVDRVTAGLERRVREGKWMSGRTPYGYTRDKESKLLVPDPVKAPVVRRIFNLYADGKLGTTAIARTLDAEAAPSPRKNWLVAERAATDPRQPRLPRTRPLERRNASRPAGAARRRRHL
jgi:DNA invertase Pin-like site-specific DNA recombinase